MEEYLILLILNFMERNRCFLVGQIYIIDNLNRHPSQIYEAIFEGLLLFIILNYLVSRDNKKMDIYHHYF